MEEKTYWNGVEAKAEKVTVIVGPPLKPTWWCAHLEGQTLAAVKVTVEGSKPFYLENETGEGWAKVTKGLGSPQWPHKSVPVISEV